MPFSYIEYGFYIQFFIVVEYKHIVSDSGKKLTPASTQMWLPVPDDAEEQSALLEQLVAEASLRM